MIIFTYDRYNGLRVPIFLMVGITLCIGIVTLVIMGAINLVKYSQSDSKDIKGKKK